MRITITTGIKIKIGVRMAMGITIRIMQARVATN
jgi:hypothetical protein